MSPHLIKYQLDTGLRCGNLTQTKILAHCLRQSTSSIVSTEAEQSLQSAVIVGLDAEWFEYDPSYITELGISILQPEKVNATIGNWLSPWKVIANMLNLHVRIRPNAHLVNSELCPGNPDEFQFGKTSFVDVDQARGLLRDAFVQFSEHGEPRPIIFVGHAVDNDIAVIKQRFGFDIEALGVIVATIDTQVLAVESGLIAKAKKIRLCNLIGKYGIWERYLHNAGNDTVCTMVAAILMAAGSAKADHSASYKELKYYAQSDSGNAMTPYGIPRFCTKCDSTKHDSNTCSATVICDYCMATPSLIWKAETHKTDKCREAIKYAMLDEEEPSPEIKVTVHRFPCPCSLCIESTDPKRHEVEYAYSHLEQDCIYKG
ncbi:hypothetical protein BDU57DRAFT_459517 [Ampelomyces quisqualis]|uniref:Gfd2/YDR514C-like C-terminal domain-containing protein n=1 Tax=Ampelomyces quisqualis TaxID=50730 RepID=A0A6A5QD86_AMPQU|nr:hypothetical protein BDU57DRAFT_459517 [Ampelomyces quisqualis]